MKCLLIILSLVSLACGSVITSASMSQPIAPASMTAVKAAASAEPTEQGARAGTVCNSYGLNVREGPGTEYAGLDVIEDGTQVTILYTRYDEQGYSWHYVQYQGGEGFVRAKYVCEE